MTKKKILIIEDEKTLLAAIKSKLMMRGYGVVSAEDGEEGERLIKQESPDLILLDILLPKKNGFEIMEDLYKEKNTIPIVVISNSGQPVEIQRALDLGVKDYLIKVDFSPTEVLEKVEKIIGSGLPIAENQINVGPSEDTTRENILPDKDYRSGGPVLIVEDDEFLRQLIAQKLLQEGFEPLAAIDSTEAFKSLEEKKPLAILLDLILPGIDGYEILKKLKENPQTKSIPVLVLSNLGQREDIDKAMAAGAADYLIKANFTPGEIIQHVRTVIGKNYD